MTRTTLFSTLILATAGFVTSAGSARAQYIPGFVIGPRPVVVSPPVVVNSTVVAPLGGFRTATDTYNPFWGTYTSYRGAANPYTGATVERQIVTSPFGGYQTVSAYDPYWGTPFYLPYGTGYLNQSIRPAYYGNPQMAAYYNGIAWNRLRR